MKLGSTQLILPTTKFSSTPIFLAMQYVCTYVRVRIHVYILCMCTILSLEGEDKISHYSIIVLGVSTLGMSVLLWWLYKYCSGKDKDVEGMHVYTYVCITYVNYVHVCMCVCVNVCTYVCMHAYQFYVHTTQLIQQYHCLLLNPLKSMSLYT